MEVMSAAASARRDTELLADSVIAYAKMAPKFLVPTQLLRELRSWIVDSITAGIKAKGWLHVCLLILLVLNRTNDPH